MSRPSKLRRAPVTAARWAGSRPRCGLDPEASFRFDAAGAGTLRTAEASFPAGRFETPSIGDLRKRAVCRPERRRGRPRAPLGTRRSVAGHGYRQPPGHRRAGDPLPGCLAVQLSGVARTPHHPGRELLQRPDPRAAGFDLRVSRYFVAALRGPRRRRRAFRPDERRPTTQPARGGLFAGRRAGAQRLPHLVRYRRPLGPCQSAGEPLRGHPRRRPRGRPRGPWLQLGWRRGRRPPHRPGVHLDFRGRRVQRHERRRPGLSTDLHRPSPCRIPGTLLAAAALGGPRWCLP